MASKYYKREFEINNLIQLFNILYDEAFHAWDENKTSNNSYQNKLSRIIRSKSIMSWTEILKDAIAAKLDIIDGDVKEMLFYRELTTENIEKIRMVVRRLIEWSIWSSPKDSEIDRILSDNKSEVKRYMKSKGLTAGYLLGAPE